MSEALHGNTAYYSIGTFSKMGVLNSAPRDQDKEAAALRYLDKWAPDLLGMILGRVA